MKKSQEIVQLADEILNDITSNRIPLHNILLKSSRLSLLLDIPKNVELFKLWAKYAEQNAFVLERYKIDIDATKNSQYNFERVQIRTTANQVSNYLANYRTESYAFALGIYTKYKFGNLAEGIFERKRSKAEPILQNIFPDINQRLNSIEQNISSNNSEDWKNSVFSCRTLLMEIADILNPAKKVEDKNKYINRLKDFVSTKTQSKTQTKLINTYLEEIKKRIKYTLDITQGGSHKDRKKKEEAEDVILYTYLIIADLVQIYTDKQNQSKVDIAKKETI